MSVVVIHAEDHKAVGNFIYTVLSDLPTVTKTVTNNSNSNSSSNSNSNNHGESDGNNDHNSINNSEESSAIVDTDTMNCSYSNALKKCSRVESDRYYRIDLFRSCKSTDYTASSSTGNTNDSNYELLYSVVIMKSTGATSSSLESKEVVVEVVQLDYVKGLATGMGIDSVEEYQYRGNKLQSQSQLESHLQSPLQLQLQSGKQSEKQFSQVANNAKLCSIVGPENVSLVLIQLETCANTANSAGSVNSIVNSKNIVLDVYLEWKLNSVDFDRNSWNSSEDKLDKSLEKDDKSTALVPSDTSNSWKPPRGVRLLTLRTYLLHNRVYRPIPINTVVPIPYKTELFTGEMLLLINTGNSQTMSEHYVKRFSGTKNKFEVAFQGKFNKIPTGPLFLGAEITKKMELGLFTKGMSNSILQLGRSINTYLHHSFGDNNNYELPHIVGPLWTTADRMIVTPHNETPPSLLELLPEPTESRAARKKSSFTLPIDLSCTYSFSFRTSKLDMEKWLLVNVPLMKEVDLHTFWSDADVRLVAYCVPTDANNSTRSDGIKQHTQASNEYFFAVDVQNRSNHPEWGNQRDEELSPTPRPDQTTSRSDLKLSDVVIETNTTTISEKDDVDSIGSFESSDEDMYFDPDEGVVNFDSPKIISHTDAYPSDRTTFSNQSSNLVLEKSIASSIDISAVASNPLVIATVFVDHQKSRQPKTKRALYVFKDILTGNGVYSLRSFREFEVIFGIKKLPQKPCYYHRLTDTEKRRLKLDYSYRALLSQMDIRKDSKLSNFLNDKTLSNQLLSVHERKSLAFGIKFLQSNHNFGTNSMKDSLVCVLDSGRVWSEHTLVITLEEFIFIKSHKTLGVAEKTRFSLRCVLDVFAIEHSDNPLPLNDIYTFVISTFSRQYVVAVRGKEVRDDWINIYKEFLSYNNGNVTKDNGPLINTLHENRFYQENLKSKSRKKGKTNDFEKIYDDTLNTSLDKEDKVQGLSELIANEMELLSKPLGLQLGDKSVLNCRNYTASGYKYLLSQESKDLFTDHVSEPWILIEKLLDIAFSLSAAVMLGNDAPTYTASFGSNNHSNSNSNNSSRRNSKNLNQLLDNIDECTIGDLQKRITNCDEKEMLSKEAKQLWINFMDGISLLQNIDLSTIEMTNDQSTSMFLNLYHLIAVHTALVVGIPNSIFKWNNFFRNSSYWVFGDIISLAELEHCVIRKAMPAPNLNLLTKQFILPSTSFDFALTIRDYRILWAINCGSLSNLPFVPIYNATMLNDQLEYITRCALERQLAILDGNVIILPQICQWFPKDFEIILAGNDVGDPDLFEKHSSTRKMLLNLSNHVKTDHKIAIKDIVKNKSDNSITLKYFPFDYKCRLLLKLSDENL